MTPGLFECFSLVCVAFWNIWRVKHRNNVKNKEENKKILITKLPVYQRTQILTGYMCLKKFKSRQNGY